MQDTVVQKVVKPAARRGGLTKRAAPHPFRHSFATPLREDSYDIRIVQKLLGRRDVTTTQLSSHALKPRAVRRAQFGRSDA